MKRLIMLMFLCLFGGALAQRSATVAGTSRPYHVSHGADRPTTRSLMPRAVAVDHVEVEAGAKFVTVYFSDSIGGQSTTSGGWDTHGFNNTRMYPIIEKYHLPITDQTLPTFLEDLDERGLLESTLVVWVGEFGPTYVGDAERVEEVFATQFDGGQGHGALRAGAAG